MPVFEIPSHIQTLSPYVPGKPIEETQREFKLKKVIKLASNENPLGPSPKALAALKASVRGSHLYPDASAYRLKRRISRMYKVPPESILVSNGSNEAIDLLIRTVCVPGDQIVTSEAAFVAYEVCAQAHGTQTLKARLDSEMRFDLQAMARLVRENARVKVVFIPNPNNPTGTYNTEKELNAFMEEIRAIRGGSVIVALDYAYWEYVTAKDLPNPMEYVRSSERVVVLQTFSKAYGLAGLRVGYLIGHPELVGYMNRIRMPFNVGSGALAAAEAALDDRAFVKRARAINREGMKLWEKTLRRWNVPFLPSQGNFLLVNVQRGFGKSGVEVFQAALRKGVIFRPVANYGLHDYLRISVGTQAENRLAIRVLEEFR